MFDAAIRLPSTPSLPCEDAPRGGTPGEGTLDEELDGLFDAIGLDAEIARHEAAIDTIGVPRPSGSPRPFFCPAALVPRFESVCDVVHRSLETIARAYFVEGRYREEIPIPAHLARLVHGRQPYPTYDVFGRFDIHLGPEPGDVQILELNCADPSAIAWHDWMIRAATRTRAFERMAGRHRLSWQELVPLHWDVLRSLAGDRQGRTLGEGLTFAIADGSTVRFDFVAFARLYRELGIDAILCDPSSLRRAEAGLTVGGTGRRVTGIVRDTLDEVAPPPGAPETGAGDFRDVLEEGHAFVVNPTCAVLADQKTVLELLSDPAAVPEIPRADRALLDEVIPWTRTLRPRRTTYGEAEVDLVSWALENQHALVLKPAEGYGGFDVTVGRSVDGTTWRQCVLLAATARHPFVVQRYVKPRSYRMPPRVSGREPVRVPFNLSLWSFAGRFVGAIARASERASAVVNVHQGGVLQPVVFYR